MGWLFYYKYISYFEIADKKYKKPQKIKQEKPNINMHSNIKQAKPDITPSL